MSIWCVFQGAASSLARITCWRTLFFLSTQVQTLRGYKQHRNCLRNQFYSNFWMLTRITVAIIVTRLASHHTWRLCRMHSFCRMKENCSIAIPNHDRCLEIHLVFRRFLDYILWNLAGWSMNSSRTGLFFLTTRKKLQRFSRNKRNQQSLDGKSIRFEQLNYTEFEKLFVSLSISGKLTAFTMSVRLWGVNFNGWRVWTFIT